MLSRKPVMPTEYTADQVTNNFIPQNNVSEEKPQLIPEVTHRTMLVRTIGEFVFLFIAGVGLFGWQMGNFNISADSLQATATEPLKMFAILIWFVIFSLLFLVPATVYSQLAQAHRPHVAKAIHHPLVRWLPIIVVALMAANIYFLTP